MYKEGLPSRLKDARNKTGLTQKEVSSETGISHISIARYETGTREPNVENLGILAEFYGVSTDWLFGIGKKSEIDINRMKENKEALKDLEKTAKKEKKLAN